MSDTTKFEYEDLISAEFNALKAKLYNLIEMSALNSDQQTAAKGLIKGFCNESFYATIEEMRWFLKNIGHLKDEDWGELYEDVPSLEQ